MSRELKPGQRVRVTVRNRIAGFQPGDTGMVLHAATRGAIGERFFLVAMDKGELDSTGVIFTEGEIEPEE
jgi:hypothetical protein